MPTDWSAWRCLIGSVVVEKNICQNSVQSCGVQNPNIEEGERNCNGKPEKKRHLRRDGWRKSERRSDADNWNVPSCPSFSCLRSWLHSLAFLLVPPFLHYVLKLVCSANKTQILSFENIWSPVCILQFNQEMLTAQFTILFTSNYLNVKIHGGRIFNVFQLSTGSWIVCLKNFSFVWIRLLILMWNVNLFYICINGCFSVNVAPNVKCHLCILMLKAYYMLSRTKGLM